MRTSSLIGFSLLLIASNAFAQITVTSLTEMQRGEVPGSDSTAISTVYEQFNVDYSQKDLQAGIRAEVYNVWGADRQITQITQKYARWSHGSAYIVAGTYYAMLGRGLTLRAFELPGVVLESTLYRLRYSPSQDLEGGMATWTGDKVEFKALVGRPAESDVPPGAKRGNPPQTIPRREDWVAGSELSLRPFQPLKVGGTFVHINPSNQALDNHQAWSALSEIDLTPFLDRTGERGIYGSFYGEYAERFARGEGGPDGHGLYLSGNIGGGRLGLSAEYKNYANFTLGFNDPPSLIREHSTFLLNKATHVLLSLNESGYQFEGTYTQPDLATFTGNIAYAKNELSATIVKTYKERYLAVDLEKFAPTFLATAYFDWGEDGIEGIEKRRIGGITLETTAWTDHSLGFEFQMQRAKRIFGIPPDFWDTYGQVSWQHPKGFGAALVVDHTTDPFEVDRPETRAIETGKRTFWSLNLNARFGTQYDAVLFAGERRGGTACTSGICYQVLPFKGLEMRINTYF